jgi:hypothetical protein
MFRIMLAAVAAFSLASLGTADAASKRKRHVVRSAPVLSAPIAPSARTPGPSWANPYDCYTDEGYGRYLPCSSGRDQ